jgi:hypothetical protein
MVAVEFARFLGGRFASIPTTGFAYGNATHRRTWRSLVAILEHALRT